MKKNVLKNLAIVLAISFGLLSCGGGSSDNPIVGSWKIVKAEGNSASLNVGVNYTFNDDNTASIEKGLKTEYGYTLSNDTLRMDLNNEGNFVLEWIVKIDGNKMTMQSISSDQKFFLEK